MKCLECGTVKVVDPFVMLASMPPQPSYYCPNCQKEKHEQVEFQKKLNHTGQKHYG